MKISCAIAACALATPILVWGQGWKSPAVTSVDQMTGKHIEAVIAVSESSLNFSFPYSGQNFGQLDIYKHPRRGEGVRLMIEQGQIMCSEYAGCPILIRFDQDQPIRFEGVGAADHDPTVVFLQGGVSRFIAKAKKARSILVQFRAFQNGEPVLSFATPEGLQWPPQAKTKPPATGFKTCESSLPPSSPLNPCRRS